MKRPPRAERPRMGITLRITLAFLLLVGVLSAGTSLAAYLVGRQTLQNAVQSELLSTAIEKEAALGAWAAQAQTHVASLAATPDIENALAALASAESTGDSASRQASHDHLVTSLLVWIGPDHPFQDILVLDYQTGQVWAATAPGDEGKFMEDWLFFVEGQKGPYVQNPLYSVSAQKPVMFASAPIRDQAGRLLGVLAGQLNLEGLNAIIQRSSGVRQTLDAFLVNTSNLFVTQPRFVPDPAVLQRGIHTEAVNRCLQKTSGQYIGLDYRGVPALIAYRWVATRDLCLIVKMNQAEAFAPAQAFGETILVVGALAMLLASALSVGLARTITRPILALQAGAVRFGEGDLESRVDVTTADELGQLADAFNDMAVNLRAKARENTQLFEALRQSHAELEKRVEDRTAELSQTNQSLRAEIAERERAEAALRESEKKFSLLFHKSAVPTVLTKPPEGVIVDANQAHEALVGYTRQETLGKSALELGIIRPAEEEQLKAGFRERGSLASNETRIVTKAGEERIVISTWNALHLGGQAYILGTLQDITARKQAEEALRESESKFVAIFQNAPMAIALSSLPDGVFVDVNEAYEKLFGYTRAEVVGRTSLEIGMVPAPQVREQILAQIKQQGFAHHVELAYRTKDGRPIVISGNIDQVTINGERFILNTFENITERKRAEATLARQREDLARSNAELEQFAYVASHDLQEPLRMVSSYVTLLAHRYQGKLDAKADKYITYTVEGATRMQTLINDLLAYSRVGTRGKPFEPVACDQILDRALANLEVAVQETGAVITREPLPSLPGDEVQLVQLFQNLVGNALKFHRPEQPPRIHITARRQDDEWLLAVQDNGIGIEPQHLERIFIIFQRLHTREEYPGTGIGLAVCKKIVQRHHGRIWVESELGRGTKFYVALPSKGDN